MSSPLTPVHPSIVDALHPRGYDIERELGRGGMATVYLARFIQGLIPKTPREMPVPYTELSILGAPLYSFGGANPTHSNPP